MAPAARKREMQDFDDAAVYKRYEDAVKNPNTENFVIEFDSENARAALDLEEREVLGFLEKEVNMRLALESHPQLVGSRDSPWANT